MNNNTCNLRKYTNEEVIDEGTRKERKEVGAKMGRGITEQEDSGPTYTRP